MFFLGTTSPNPFDMSGLSPNLMSTTSASNTGTKPKKSVHSLLGEHSNLVNLDNLVTADNKKNSTQGMQFHFLLISRHTKKNRTHVLNLGRFFYYFYIQKYGKDR